MRIHHTGSEEVFAWAAETDTYPEFTDNDYGTAPSISTYATFYDSPTVVKYGGPDPLYTGGSDESLAYTYPQRYAEITGPVRVGSKAFIQKLVKDGTGYKNLADLAIYLGFGAPDESGEIYRWCKCAQAAFSFQQDREIMVTPTFRSMGWPEQVVAESELTPNYAALAGSTNPLGWTNVVTITIGGTAYRDVITGVDFTVNNSLTADNTRRNLGEDVPISRGATLLKPGHVIIEGTIQLNSELDDAQLIAADNSMNWGSMVITCNDAGIGGSQTFVVTLTRCLPRQQTKNGGDPRQQVRYSVPFTARGVAIT